jgi:acylpyruvate hydrolase
MRSFHVIGKKIIGVGSNYRCHIKEMGGQVPTEPIFFLKPTTSYLLEPNPIRIPLEHEVHHEVELGVVIGRGGANIAVKDAPLHVAGYCLALDLTARDLQVHHPIHPPPLQ